jgi:hypothetical protein
MYFNSKDKGFGLWDKDSELMGWQDIAFTADVFQ